MDLLRRRSGPDLDATEERLLWIVCAPRSGSTWLMQMLGCIPGVLMVDEPHIGMHVGLWSAEATTSPYDEPSADVQIFHRLRAQAQDYFFAESFRDAWAPHLRAMILARFAAHGERWGTAQTRMIVIKEPNGSQGAGLVLGVVPRSRMVHLVRDPRDVVVSHLAAYRSGTWLAASFPGADLEAVPREQRVHEFALRWAVRAQVAIEAFDRHDPALRLRLRYEELRAEPATGLAAVLRWAGLPDRDAAEIADRRAFESLPEQDRGAAKFARRAQPGEWREALSEAEQAVVLRLCGEQMATLGYEL